MESHGDRRFHCTLCNKQFSQNSNLKRHLLTHTGKKPYQCNFCIKAFSQLTQLKGHIMTQTGEKSHQGEQDLKVGHTMGLLESLLVDERCACSNESVGC